MLVVLVVYEKDIDQLIIFSKPLTIPINVFIYDNSKDSQEIPIIDNVSFYYEHDPSNSGVSRAYNQGAKLAEKLGFEKILLLDQDSNFDFNDLCKYESLYKKYSSDYIYAPVVVDKCRSKIYSPGYLNRFVGKPQDYELFKYEEVQSLEGKSLINSGLMIPLTVFHKANGFNEKLKLDFSDVYFVEKYKKNNIEFVLVDICLEHSLSGDEGLNYTREFTRFKYYCYSAREVGRSLNVLVLYSPFRRLLRLTLKYKKLSFFFVFLKHFILGKEV